MTKSKFWFWVEFKATRPTTTTGKISASRMIDGWLTLSKDITNDDCSSMLSRPTHWRLRCLLELLLRGFKESFCLTWAFGVAWDGRDPPEKKPLMSFPCAGFVSFFVEDILRVCRPASCTYMLGESLCSASQHGADCDRRVNHDSGHGRVESRENHVQEKAREIHDPPQV